MAGRHGDDRVVAAGRRTRAPPRRPRLPTAARRGADPLRVLRDGNAVRGAEAHSSDDRAGPANERVPPPPVTRRETTGGPGNRRAVPLPGGCAGDERTVDRRRLEED